MKTNKFLFRAIAFALVLLAAFVPSACSPATTDAEVPAEELKSFMGLDLAEAGTVKAVPGSTYALGVEVLPGGYVFAQIDGQTVSLTCHGLTFQFVTRLDRDGGNKMILPGGQTLGNKPKYEVETTSCHFTVEFPPSGEKLLTIYK